MIVLLTILITLQINSLEIKPLPKIPPKNIENLSKEEIYNCAYEYYLQCEKLLNELNIALENTEKEIKISEEKDNIILEYEKLISKYKKVQNKYGIGLSAYIGLTKTLEIDSFVSCDIYFHFFNNHISFVPGFYVKIYDEIGGGLKLGLAVNF